MSKRAKADDLFDQMVPGEKAAPATPVVEQSGDELKARMVRMSDKHWRILGSHFKAQGLATAAGIRKVLYDYMTEHRLI